MNMYRMKLETVRIAEDLAKQINRDMKKANRENIKNIKRYVENRTKGSR